MAAASGRYDRLHETAFDYAYILTQMGISITDRGGADAFVRPASEANVPKS